MVLADSRRLSRIRRYSGNPIGVQCISRTGLLPSSAHLSWMLPLCIWFCNSVTVLMHRPSAPTTPDWQRHQALPPTRFRLIPFRSPLLRESLLFSSPRGTEMFQFPRFPLAALYIQAGVTGHYPSRVSPFGYLRVIGCLHLTEAFRRLLRPSSAPCPKASTMRPS